MVVEDLDNQLMLLLVGLTILFLLELDGVMLVVETLDPTAEVAVVVLVPLVVLEERMVELAVMDYRIVLMVHQLPMLAVVAEELMVVEDLVEAADQVVVEEEQIHQELEQQDLRILVVEEDLIQV